MSANIQREWEEAPLTYRGIVESLSQVHAVVIGDAIVDQYYHGRIERISPEAPVPIFIEDPDKREVRRGGADNVAHQLEALGCQVTTCFPEPRSVKHRYMVGHYQVFRRDDDVCVSPTASQLAQEWGPCDVIVLSDYAKGFLTDELCKRAIHQAHEQHIPVVVDPKGSRWSKYRGASLICPNESEWLAWQASVSWYPVRCPVMVKRGEHGLRIIDEQGVDDIAARARAVFDVTGAGDCVVAVVAAVLGLGCDLRNAATLAAHAAGYAVGEVGTAVCPKERLLELIS